MKNLQVFKFKKSLNTEIFSVNEIEHPTIPDISKILGGMCDLFKFLIAFLLYLKNHEPVPRLYPSPLALLDYRPCTDIK